MRIIRLALRLLVLLRSCGCCSSGGCCDHGDVVSSSSSRGTGGDLTFEYACVACAIAVHAYLSVRDRYYLTNRSLLGAAASPWSRVRDNGDDNAFIICTGFSRAVFDYLAHEFECEYNRVAAVKKVTGKAGRPRVLAAADVLAIVLHWYRSRMTTWCMQLIFGIGPAILSRAMRCGSWALSKTLDRLPAAVVRWPDHEQLERFSLAMQEYEPDLPAGCCGFIDGTVIQILNPSDPEEQNAYYSGSHRITCINNVFYFAPDGTICSARLNCPGSWHDSKVCEILYRKLMTLPHGSYGSYYVLADSAFKATDELQDKVVKSSRGGTTAMSMSTSLDSDPDPDADADAELESLISGNYMHMTLVLLCSALPACKLRP